MNVGNRRMPKNQKNGQTKNESGPEDDDDGHLII
jgi:hypothetical protein